MMKNFHLKYKNHAQQMKTQMMQKPNYGAGTKAPTVQCSTPPPPVAQASTPTADRLGHDEEFPPEAQEPR